VAADVYAHPMHFGRGGWTWYTGSAGWMYQAAISAVLGLQRNGATMSVSPCIPAVWPQCSLEWKINRTRYRFTVSNPDHQCCGVGLAELDGNRVDASAIPIVDDGHLHEVMIVLGTRRSATLSTGATGYSDQRTGVS
jgi:cellobiose phosphorylase